MKKMKKWLSLITVTMFVVSFAATPVEAASYASVMKLINSIQNNRSTTEPAPAPQPAPQPAPAPAPAPEKSDFQFTAYEKRVTQLVNIERQKRGLRPLTLDKQLTIGARAKADDFTKYRYFSHNSPKYGSPFKMMKTFGISYRYAGENIASGQRSPESVVKAWMNSPGHRANILSSKFTKIGVGYDYTTAGSYHHFWVQWFKG